MLERNQNFHNHALLHTRDGLFLRQKLVWVLENVGEKLLKKKILEVDKRWKKERATAIIFDLKENWELSGEL
jgi:hypothetical protein